MKIRCESCAAKYSIADDKVRGRAFKIRCKRCQSPIVVRGDAVLSKPVAPEGDWHVVVDGDERGPLTLEGLVDTGATADCHVWREGWSEWRLAGDVSAIAAALGASDDDVVTSSPSLPDAASALTGSRNESSVLFSIANLSALASQGPKEPAEDAASSDAPTEGSGLIDIRALAASLDSPATAAAPDRVDDLLRVGAPLNAGPLMAPVLPPAPAASNRLPAILGASVGLFALAAAAVVAGVALTRGGEATVAHAEDIVPRDHVVDVQTTLEDNPAPRETGALPQEPAAEPEAPAETEAGPVPVPTETRTRRPTRPREPSPRVEVTAPRERAQTDGDRSIARLMAETFDEPEPTRERPSRTRPEANAPSTPTRAQVTRAMNGVATAVRGCGEGSHGLVPVTLVFRGQTGRVASAQVEGGTLSPAARSCVARAARGAELAPFSRDTFRVRYPFRI